MTQEKIDTLCSLEGIDIDELMFDSVSPGICMNEDCDYTIEVEPDCSTGWCEECETQTVKSAVELLLEGYLPNGD